MDPNRQHIQSRFLITKIIKHSSLTKDLDLMENSLIDVYVPLYGDPYQLEIYNFSENCIVKCSLKRFAAHVDRNFTMINYD